MPDERPTDEKGRPLDYMTEVGIFLGAYKQFPNRTVLTTPSKNLGEDVKKSLDRVADKNAGGCWGKSKK